jgi:hypothetical protein
MGTTAGANGATPRRKYVRRDLAYQRRLDAAVAMANNGRTAADLSDAQIARLHDISPPTLRKHRHGGATPRPSVVDRVVREIRRMTPEEHTEVARQIGFDLTYATMVAPLIWCGH